MSRLQREITGKGVGWGKFFDPATKRHLIEKDRLPDRQDVEAMTQKQLEGIICSLWHSTDSMEDLLATLEAKGYKVTKTQIDEAIQRCRKRSSTSNKFRLLASTMIKIAVTPGQVTHIDQAVASINVKMKNMLTTVTDPDIRKQVEEEWSDVHDRLLLFLDHFEEIAKG